MAAAFTSMNQPEGEAARRPRALWTMRAVSLLLAAAAVLKLHGLTVEPVAAMGSFSSPAWQWLLVLGECLLALWLFWGSHPIGSWLTALLAFTAFGVVSFHHGVIGAASCGCFGAVSVSPWAAFVLDVAILAVLLLGRPDLRRWWERPTTLRRAAAVGGSTVIAAATFLGLLAGASILSFGSADAALAFFRGERLTVEPRLVDVGEGSTGENREVSVQVRNWTAKPIRIVGGTADCSCAVTDDLPLTVPSGEGRLLTVRVRLPDKPGIFTRKVWLRTDHEQASVVVFRLTGQSARDTEAEKHGTESGK